MYNYIMTVVPYTSISSGMEQIVPQNVPESRSVQNFLPDIG